ncbi:MAG: DUF2061 domain-containing protein [Bacteroidia bacterium]
MKEGHLRSVIKGVTWRVIGTADTLMLSYLLTGSIGDASKIAGTEMFTKIALYYLHERVWMKLNFWRKLETLPDGSVKIVDHHKRSLFKGISWRCFGTVDTILIALFWTGDYKKALAIGFAEVFTKIFLYYMHERLWLKIKWGQKPHIVSAKVDKADESYSPA